MSLCACSIQKNSLEVGLTLNTLLVTGVILDNRKPRRRAVTVSELHEICPKLETSRWKSLAELHLRHQHEMRQNYRRSSIQEDRCSLVLRHRMCSNVEFCELVFFMVRMLGKWCFLECIELQHINFISWQTGTAAVAVLSAFKRNIPSAYWRVGFCKKKTSSILMPCGSYHRCHFPCQMFWHCILLSGTKLNISELYTYWCKYLSSLWIRVIRVIFLHLLNFLTNMADITLNTQFLALFKCFPVHLPQTFCQNDFSLQSLQFKQHC
jgi:hypothetical protein